MGEKHGTGSPRALTTIGAEISVVKQAGWKITNGDHVCLPPSPLHTSLFLLTLTHFPTVTFCGVSVEMVSAKDMDLHQLQIAYKFKGNLAYFL